MARIHGRRPPVNRHRKTVRATITKDGLIKTLLSTCTSSAKTVEVRQEPSRPVRRRQYPDVLFYCVGEGGSAARRTLPSLRALKWRLRRRWRKGWAWSRNTRPTRPGGTKQT